MMAASEPIEQAALRLLSELDPYGLAPGEEDGAPRDEYAPEARSIAECMQADKRITVAQIDAVWSKWFDEPLSGRVGEARVAQLARELTDEAAADPA